MAVAASPKPRRARRVSGPDEVLTAQRDALAASLRAVLCLVDRTAFAWPKDQEALWAAEALLAEVGA